jgi:N-acetylglucosamine kinase-like BadF-type ATPase
MTLVLGVDGGNTKTIALVARADGTIVGAGRGGCADIYGASSIEDAFSAVADAIAGALAAAEATAADVTTAVLALAGADWPEDFTMLAEELPPRTGLQVPPVIMNDATASIRTGTDDGVGIAVAVGTGGAIGGRDAAGRAWHRGFWPDSMGARAMGRSGLRAVYRADYGFDRETALTAAIVQACGVADASELLHAWTRRGGIPPDRAGDLAPVVLDIAAAGDPVARDIVLRQGTVLGECVDLTARHLDLPEPYTLVLAGGLLRHPRSDLLVEPILAYVPGARPVHATREPAVGALLFAFDSASLQPDETLLDASVPTAIFETWRPPLT